MRRRDLNDIMVGLLLIALALLALYLSRSLSTGSATSMGPGYVPRLLAGLQIVLGAAIAVAGFLRRADGPEPWVLRPIIWIPASVVFFALAIENLGLAIAVFGLVLLACLAHRGTRPVEAVSLAAFMATFTVLVFVTALGQTMPVWPPGWWH